MTINELAEREEAVPSPPATGWITITELCAAYLQHAQGYYVNKAGEPTDQLDKVKRLDSGFWLTGSEPWPSMNSDQGGSRQLATEPRGGRAKPDRS